MRVRIRSLAASHAGVLSVLAAGVLLRVLTQIAYGPALYYYDSVAYLAQANGDLFSNAAEPAGYPVAIRILRLGSSNLTGLTVVQHLAGLATGLLVYVVATRLTGRKALGAIGAAIVLFDGYLLAVEQYVMTDAFFVALLMASAALTLLARRRSLLALAGLILAAACLVRATGIFCVPIWLVYVLWRYRLTSTAFFCAAAVLLPIAAYAAVNDARTGHFAITDDTAWLLYARTASIGDCRGLSIPAAERVLCPHGSQLRRGANYYLEGPDSPAARALGSRGPAVHEAPRADHLLLGFALHVLSQRPLAYAGLVAGDFFDAFVPGAPNDTPNLNGAISLPRGKSWLWPFYHPPQRWPARAVRAYAGVVHTVRPLLALLLVIGCLALAFPPDRRTSSTRPPIALLLAMAVALLLGAAFGHFELRYVLPAVPLLACGGMLGTAALWDRLSPTYPTAAARTRSTR